MMNSHIDVTVDFRELGVNELYDLRIPVQITVKKVLMNLIETLRIANEVNKYVIKIKTKGLILMDDDVLTDYPIANGDILTVICEKQTNADEGVI